MGRTDSPSKAKHGQEHKENQQVTTETPPVETRASVDEVKEEDVASAVVSKPAAEPDAKMANLTENPTPERGYASAVTREEDQEGAMNTARVAPEKAEMTSLLEEAVTAEVNMVADAVSPEVEWFDFGPGFFTRCSTCGKLSMN